jgi:hypothetical protein
MKRLMFQLTDRFFAVKKGPRPPLTEEEERIRVSLETLRRLLQEAVQAGFDRDVATILAWLGHNGPLIEKTVVAWIDLIELLVQHTEGRYGTGPGKGKLKAMEVKAVIRYLLRTQRFNLPKVPDYLEPFVLEIVVDWSIDAVVELANDNDLWVPTQEKPASFTKRLALFVLWLLRLLRPVWSGVARLVSWIYWGLYYRMPLSPEIRAAVDRINKEGLMVNPQQLLKGLSEAVVWLGTHRRSIVAGVALISAAVQEAERFISLSGPEKKEYARAFVWAVLDELGFDVRSGLFYALVDALISSLIESAVHLFNSRGLFQHGSSREASA